MGNWRFVGKKTCRGFSRLPPYWLLASLLFSACTYTDYQALQLECKPGDMEPGAPPSWTEEFPITAENGIFNPGFTPNGWWVRTTVRNPGSKQEQLAIALNNPHINDLRVYFDGESRPAYITGDAVPFSQRPMIDRDFVVPLNIAAGDSVRVLMWMDKAGESLQVQAELYTLEGLQAYRQDEAFGMGLILGWMLFICLFGLFIFFNVRQITYLFYSLYVLAASAWTTAQWGTGFRYFWPDSPDFSSMARPLFMMLSAAVFLMVIVSFFPATPRNLIWSKVITGLWSIAGVLILILLVFGYKNLETGTKLILLNAGQGVILGSIVAAVAYLYNAHRDGARLTGYYFAAIGMVLISALLLNLIQYGLYLPLEKFINTYASSVGLLFETALITFALSQRYNSYKKEKERLSLSLVEKERAHATKLVETEEQERKRIGRDLHDTLGGLLSSVKLHMEKLKHNQPELATQLAPLEDLNDQSIAELRNISHNLVPVNLGERGLEKVLKHLLKRLTEHSRINFHLHFDVRTMLEEAVAVHVYRICFELINNTIKHASATEVVIQIVEEKNELLLIVEDNGRGFSTDTPGEGIGLRNLRHRVDYLKGTLSIDSNSEGTTVIVNLPLN